MKLLPSKLRNFVKWRSISDLVIPGKKLSKKLGSLILNNLSVNVDCFISGWKISLQVQGMFVSIWIRNR